jgi:hypothetical protein
VMEETTLHKEGGILRKEEVILHKEEVTLRKGEVTLHKEEVTHLRVAEAAIMEICSAKEAPFLSVIGDNGS